MSHGIVTGEGLADPAGLCNAQDPMRWLAR